MISARLILQTCFVFSCALGIVFAFPNQFENSKVLRSIDINHGIVREDVGIRAKNVNTKPVSEYYFYVPTILVNNTAFISGFLKKEKTELDVTLEDVDKRNALNVYKITLNKPVNPGEEVLLGLKLAYTHNIKPMPAKLPQVARQHTIYAFNTHFISPYQIKEMKTTVQTPTKSIVSQTGGEGKGVISGNKIVYGPFFDVKPLAFDIGSVHFENSKPLITITELKRDIEISHWGQNLAVEEDFVLRNDGAELETDFNRVQYQATAQIHDQTNVLKGLTFDLPVSARDPYYRDEVGNVSTSHFRNEKNKAVLEINPRYPIFGGWGYTWYHGYNADLSDYVRKSKKTGKYILNIKFVENVKDMVIDKAIVRVILPEGASNAKVTAPFSLDKESVHTHFTYFDSTGRLTVVLEKYNVVKEHQLPIQIEYEYASTRLLQKPLVASAVILLFFISSIFLNKIPFTIGQQLKASLKKE